MSCVRSSLAVIVAACVFFFSRPAAAEDFAGAFYDDIKSVFRQLIEREIATSVAPALACSSKEGLLRYYPNSLQDVYDRDFSKLKGDLEQETAALLAAYVHDAIQNGRPKPLEAFLPLSQITESLEDVTQGQCVKDVRKVGGPRHYAALTLGEASPLAECRRSSPGETSTEQAERKLRCAVAEGVRALALGRKDAARSHWLEALAHTQSAPLKKLISKELADDVSAGLARELGALIEHGRFSEGGLIAPLADPALRAALSGAGSAVDSSAAMAWKRALDWFAGSSVPQVTINGKPLADPLQALEAVSASDGSRLGERIALVLFQASGQFAGGDIRVEVNGTDSVKIDNVTGAGPVRFSGKGLSRLESWAVSLEHTRALGRLFPGTLEKEELASNLEKALAIIDWLNGVGKRLNQGGFSLQIIVRYLQETDCPSLVEKVSPAGETPRMEVDACVLMQQLAGWLDRDGHLRRMVIAAAQEDVRAVALEAMQTAFSDDAVKRVCCANGETCERTLGMFARLAKAIAGYALIEDGDESTTEAAREAFRTAASDAIFEMAQRSPGINGRISTGFRWLWLPRIALRRSWSASYSVNSEEVRVRHIATVDLLRFRLAPVRKPLLWVELDFSFIDALAPLTELAARTNVDYGNDGLIAFMLFHPRIDLTLAVPALSSHLALAAGVGLRGAIPIKAADDDGNPYQYGIIFNGFDVHNHEEDFDEFLRATELSLAIKYIF